MPELGFLERAQRDKREGHVLNKDAKSLLELMHRKRSNLCIAADFRTAAEVLEVKKLLLVEGRCMLMVLYKVCFLVYSWQTRSVLRLQCSKRTLTSYQILIPNSHKS